MIDSTDKALIRDQQSEGDFKNAQQALLEADEVGCPIENILTNAMLDALWKKSGADSVLAELRSASFNEFPAVPLLLTQRHLAEVEDQLIKIVSDSIAKYQDTGDVDGIGHILAMYLLAELKSEKFLPVLLQALRLPGEGASDLLEDSITEDLAQILAVLLHDSSVLDDLIRDPTIYEFTCWAAAMTYVFFVRDGKLSREDASDRLAGHLRWAVENRKCEIATGIVVAIGAIAKPQAMGVIERGFTSGMVGEEICSLSEIKEFIAGGDAAFQNAMADVPVSGISDAFLEVKSWSAWTESDNEFWDGDWDDPSSLYDSVMDPEIHLQPGIDEIDLSLGEDVFDGDSQTIRNQGNSVGRNELCPCFSGKKYKKCCGRR